VRDLPNAIASMVEHAQANFEAKQTAGKVTPAWKEDYESLIELFALAHIAWNEVIEDSASWHIIRDALATRWTLYVQAHPVGFTKSEYIQQFAEFHPEEAHTWSPQKISDYLKSQGVDVARPQVWRVLHKPKT
jgi:hypothetical protein